MTNIILLDFEASQNWEFKKAIEESTKKQWQMMCSVSNKNHGNVVQKLIRYVKYFFFPLSG